MTTLIVPTRTDLASYTQRVVLDGREYQLAFQWNEREAKWYLDLADVEGTVLLPSIKLVVGAPLFRLLTDRRAPPGECIVLDRSGTGEDPGLTDLGLRCLLTYIPAEDLAAAAG